MTKLCKVCCTEKPIEQFYRNKGMSDGYLNRCIPCHNIFGHQNYRKNRDYYRKYEIERNKTVKRKQQKLETQRRRRLQPSVELQK